MRAPKDSQEKGRSDGVDWDAAYAEYLPRVYNYFRYLVGVQTVAEDLTATVFEKAWRRRDRYRSDAGALSTWLFTVAKNVARDYFQQHRQEVVYLNTADKSVWRNSRAFPSAPWPDRVRSKVVKSGMPLKASAEARKGHSRVIRLAGHLLSPGRNAEE